MEQKERKMILQVENLERSYAAISQEGKKIEYPAVRGITFDVYEGEFIAIMGRSGCGKTTLLKTIGMVDKPTKGKVFYKGKETTRIFGDRLARIRRKEIAFIFQDFYLMDSLSVKDNIMLPLILDGIDPEEGLRKVERLSEKFQIFHLLNKKPYELSGGERQRTAICRAMVSDPELLLADEPTGNLDSHSSQNVIDTICKINQELRKTVLLVTHDQQIASYSNRIIYLKDGQILKDRKRKEKVGREAFYQEILQEMLFL